MLLSQSLSIRPSLNSPFASRRRVLLSAEGKLSFILMMLLRIMTKMYFFCLCVCFSLHPFFTICSNLNFLMQTLSTRKRWCRVTFRMRLMSHHELASFFMLLWQLALDSNYKHPSLSVIYFNTLLGMSLKWSASGSERTEKKALDESSFKAEFMLQRGARLTSNMTRNASGLSDLTLGVSQKIKFARCVEIKASRMRGGEGVNEERVWRKFHFGFP